MERIIIRKGKKGCPFCVLIDSEDLEKVSKLNLRLSTQNHTDSKILYCSYTCNENIAKPTCKYLHRLIMGVTDRKIYVDHIDGNGLNNQKSNLRICTHSQNMSNRRSSKNSTSRYLGVSFDTRKNNWSAECKCNGKRYKKNFKKEIDAAIYYNKVAKELKGEFARLNII